MLQLHAVESGYGMGQVLFGVSLSIAPGACVSLMGRNGMAKPQQFVPSWDNCR